jgi:hypothetical protein
LTIISPSPARGAGRGHSHAIWPGDCPPALATWRAPFTMHDATNHPREERCMGKPTEGNIKGAQDHAEGQHGKKTLERLQEINATGRDKPDPTQPEGTPNRPGKHRITEDRQQHDESELRSELTKLEALRDGDPFSTPQGRKS